MDRLLCDMSWNCTESVAMYTVTSNTHTESPLHIVHMQNSSATVSIVLVWYNRNIDKWTNRTMAIGVRVSSCRENYSIKTNWCEHTHTFTAHMMCAVWCVHSCACRSGQKLSAKFFGLFFSNTCCKDWSSIKCNTHPEADDDMAAFQHILCLWQCPTISMTFIYLLSFLLTREHEFACFFLFLRCCCCYLLFFFSVSFMLSCARPLLCVRHFPYCYCYRSPHSIATISSHRCCWLWMC